MAVVEKRDGYQPHADGPPPTVPPMKPGDARRSAQAGNARNKREQHTRYDQALRSAKNADLRIRLHLVIDCDFAPEGYFTCHVVEVDKFDVLVRKENNGEIWIKKSHILGTEVLR